MTTFRSAVARLSIALPSLALPSLALPSLALPSFALPSFALQRQMSRDRGQPPANGGRNVSPACGAVFLC
jgi:hypothetical protein